MPSNRTIVPLAEMSTLPDGWIARIDPSNNRVYYVEGNYTTYHHPTFGVIPRPWQLRIEGTGNMAREYYYNTETGEKTTKNPRFGKKELESRLLSVPKELRESATVTKNTPGLLQRMKRPALSFSNNRHKYEIVHTIDDGGGGLGGMNGGVYVVRIKGIGHSKLDVEKRFTPETLTPLRNGEPNLGVNEILITRKLMHPALANAIHAFIYPSLDHPTAASLYLEFCDRGSLQDLINQYAKRIGTAQESHIPERFAWHAFIGLCDGLSYLMGGRSFATDADARSPSALPLPTWSPVLHRDIKPDNILLRSRSTLTHLKYPYLVLSDFGLSTATPSTDPYQLSSHLLGSKPFFAPELLHFPFPSASQLQFFPPGKAHSHSSDLYALGACIYNLCRPCNTYIRSTGTPFVGAWSHFDFKTWGTLDSETWMSGTGSRRRDLDVGGPYSDQLREMVRLATFWDPVLRGNAIELGKGLVDEATRAGFGAADPSWGEMLPGWATRIHSYNAR
ncbi:NEK kinase protein [Rutstroemia sp. NJR-2017a BVV2]|nr:NEK kinase protein [Rutstroemia sp. NJR-2017a BVV2]